MRKFDGKIYEIPDGGPSDEFLHLYKTENASIPDLPSERTKLAYMVATKSGLEQEFGRASLQEVLIDYTFWLIWAESRYESSKGSFSRFARALLLKAIEKHKKKLGYNKIRRELDDQKFRDAAEKKDAALVAYLQLWVKRIQSFQKVRPSRWNVRGFDKEDLISELKVCLIQSIRDGSIVDYERPGEEATFLFLRKKIDFLNSARRIYEATSRAHLTFEPAPSPEDIVIRVNDLQMEERASAEAIASLSNRQRTWYKAFVAEARWSEDERFILARAARRIGKNPTSAIRAMKSIEKAYNRSYQKAGLRDKK